jgi:hypothetical protein
MAAGRGAAAAGAAAAGAAEDDDEDVGAGNAGGGGGVGAGGGAAGGAASAGEGRDVLPHGFRTDLYRENITKEELKQMRQILVNALSRVSHRLHNEYMLLLHQIDEKIRSNMDTAANGGRRRRTRKFKNGRRITRRNR